MSALFPELGDDEPGGSEAPAPPPARIAVGERGLATLRRLLAWDDVAPGATLERVEFVPREAELRLFFTSPSIPRAMIAVSPRSTRPAARQTHQLNLSYSGDGASRALAVVLERLHARLRNAPFEVLQRAATLRDPVPEPPPAPAPAPPAARRLPNDHLGSVAWSYLSPIGWRSFFEQKEMYRGIFHGMRGPITAVLHADIECHASDAPRFDESVNFFNFPRQEVWSTVAGRVDSRAQDGAGFIVTDMSDRDVIKGADTLLEHLLGDVSDSRHELAGGRDDGDPGMVFVVPTCISLVTGDDIDAASARSTSRRRLPVLNIGAEDDPLAVMFQKVADEPGFHAHTPRPRRVNLVGMPRVEGYSALLSLLREAGLEVGCELLPTFDLRAARQYLTASVQVLFPTDQTRHLYDSLLNTFPLETLSPPPPFGVEGTREWVAAIGAAAGVADDAAAALARRWEPLAPEWQRLRAQARGAALGVVIDDDSVHALRDPGKLLGVPLLRMVLEAGFEICALQYVAPGRPDPAPLLPEAQTVYFHSPSELHDALRGSAAQAFYSDMYADPRLAAAGRQVFSLHDVAVGFEGALETARRLLARCENPFLRRYSAYLGAEAHDAGH